MLNSLSKPNAPAANANNDPLAELEMWNKVKTSTNANDYYLFLKSFPAGGFAKQAKAKMDEFGDSQWNEVKTSQDPFAFREYIKKNPNSPFVEEAKAKMNMLAASIIEWERIKDNPTDEALIEYFSKYPNSVQAIEARKRGDSIHIKYISARDKNNVERYLKRDSGCVFELA